MRPSTYKDDTLSILDNDMHHFMIFYRLCHSYSENYRFPNKEIGNFKVRRHQRYNHPDLFDVIYNCVNQNPEPTEDPAIHEYFMIEVYDQYMQIMQEQENLRELKEQVIVRLLWHIEEWTRMTFSGINQRWGEEIYWETKYNQLRRLLPNLANHRVLVKRIRDEDSLLQVNSQTRDGLSSGGRICSTNDEILDQENNADHKNNFDVQRH